MVVLLQQYKIIPRMQCITNINLQFIILLVNPCMKRVALSFMLLYQNSLR